MIVFILLEQHVADSAVHQHSYVDPTDPEQIDSMINKAKQNAKQKPVKLSELTSISGGRQSFVGRDKPQKKRKHK